MPLAKDLYGTGRGHLAVIIGTGPSISHAVRNVMEPNPNVLRIALNDAIATIPAEYWFWIDGDAYLRQKDHPNARKAVKVGVEHFQHLYEPSVYVWERCLKDLAGDLEKGNLVHRSTSLIGAISFAMRLGCFRAVTVGCDNRVSEEQIVAREKTDPSKNWRDIYTFTFARINEAIANRKKWLPDDFALVDASFRKDTLEHGALLLPKTTLARELALLREFKEWESKRRLSYGGALGA